MDALAAALSMELAAAAVVVWAVLQLIAASWRDLGPATVAGVAVVLILAPPTPAAAGALTLAALVAGAAWIRGARHTVGRPDLVGATLAVGLAGALVPRILGASQGEAWLGRATDVAVPVIVAVGLVCTALALERPAPRALRYRWIGRIEVEVSEGPSTGPGRGETPSRDSGRS